ncbi:hypothetical protein vseg_015858 [Gypsophila vaccaria]
MAERGELEEAQSLLSRKRKSVLHSYAVCERDGPTTSTSFLEHSYVVQDCFATEEAYRGRGRAFAFSAQSAHMYQRAALQSLQCTTAALFGSVEACGPTGVSNSGVGFQTAYMQQMMKKSMDERHKE